MRSSSRAFFKRMCPKADSNISGNILIISILITLRQLNGNWLNGYILYHFKQTQGFERFFPFDKLGVRMTKSEFCGGAYKQPKTKNVYAPSSPNKPDRKSTR